MHRYPYWEIPAGLWEGETVHVIGGGRSLLNFNPDRVRGDKVIAVNNAGLDLVPFADILFFTDNQWLTWNAARLKQFPRTKVTRNRPTIGGIDIKLLRYHGAVDRGFPGLSRDPKYIGGQCGGSTAINLAYLLGGRTIRLWGFDMKPGHYHDDHKVPTFDHVYLEYIATLERMARMLEADGVDVVNMNPDSALTCFRKESRCAALSS